MAGQGCPNEGSDSRLFGRWGCWIQSRLSWRATIHPPSLILALPFYLAVNTPVPFVPAHRRYMHARIGWRYDVNWGYIFDPALKFEAVPIFY